MIAQIERLFKSMLRNGTTMSIGATSGDVGQGFIMTAGQGNGAAAGGAFVLTGGAGGSTSGAGGAFTFTGGAGTAGNAAGGAFNAVGGAGQGSAAGGAINLTGGAGGATGTGGGFTFTTGAGGSTSGASGAITIATGVTTASSGSASGAITIQSGLGSNAAAAGTGGASGAVTLQSRNGGTTATGTAGAGGTVAITGGAGGAASGAGTGGAGASVIATAGAGGSTSGGTAGLEGGIFLRATNAKLFRSQVVSTAETDANNAVDAADFVNGICVHTVSTGRTLTTPTGAQITAVCPASLAAGDSFDFTVITVGTGADDISTLTAGDGNVTFVGPVTVGGTNPSGGTGSAGTWRFRYSGTNAWVGYRLA